jgi:hypothetical protein
MLDRSLPSASGGDGASIAREIYISGLIGLLVWWVSTDFRENPGGLADEFQRLMANGLGEEANAGAGAGHHLNRL